MKKGWLKMLLTVVLIAVIAVLSINPLATNLQLGLDLRGGAEVVLQAVHEDGSAVTAEEMSQLKEVMRKRVDALGVSEPIIQNEGNDRLIIQLAGIDNPNDAIAALGRTARLEFIDPAGNVVISGTELKDAQGTNINGKVYIALEFSDEGAKKFGEATTLYVGQPISISLDGQVISSPIVQEPILNGRAQIDGNYTLEQAINEAAILKGGALPVDVEILSKRTVGPTLGAESLDKSMNATVIGLILMLAFVILWYRVPGIVAAISLVAYSIILLWLMEAVGVVLTLPGIAGFILTVGMAVDANIIIYERIKEEVRSGKSLQASIHAGFRRALWTILDANITTLLAAAVLFYFGTGAIQGFAVTLSLGILVSLFSALFLTKYLLIWSADIKAFRRNLKLYGGKERG